MNFKDENFKDKNFEDENIAGMTTLTERVLRGSKDPDYDFLKNYIIKGGGGTSSRTS